MSRNKKHLKKHKKEQQTKHKGDRRNKDQIRKTWNGVLKKYKRSIKPRKCSLKENNIDKPLTGLIKKKREKTQIKSEMKEEE